MNRLKVLIIQEVLMSYREPIYRILSERVDLTLAYLKKSQISNENYKIIKIPHFKIGPLYINYQTYNILNNYDVVIHQPHLKFIWLNRILFLKRKFKLVTWTIGVHVSYDCPYNLSKKPSFKDRCFEFLQDKADACIFYMPKPIEYWKKYKNINENKYFVAHNTVAVSSFETLPPFNEKDSFLFVGTLYRQKGIGELLEAYADANEKVKDFPVLNIIGDGSERRNIEKIISSLKLEKKVILRGPIFDEDVLKMYFFKAFLCISPKQAGLSVLKSMGYGVPFVTRSDAITGGERDNIINKENGFFYTTVEELSTILQETIQNREKLQIMSENARKHYLTFATPQIMADGVIAAIQYALKK